MPDPIAERNRLDEAASPYLHQHADNPVNWQPWDERALETAREHDAPLFVSVGYAACHWCHVMAEESFEDGAVAEALNADFVPIKVDREERPDVDRVYQTVCQLVSGRGGWPLSVFCFPDGRPFFVGTYFPREPARGQPGFLDLLGNIREAWETQRDDLERRADEWTAAARDNLESVPDSPATTAGGDDGPLPDDALLDNSLLDAADAALRSADREHGGFGRSGPKFPQPGRVELLLCAHEQTGREAYRDVVAETLDAMATGGIYDHVGGGFHRYATDRDWTVPHFEKMCYDNAELPRLYAESMVALAGGEHSGGPDRYRQVVRETLDFLTAELQHPDGGFFSTLDARSPAFREGEDGHVEGAFYTWTPEEVREAVDDEVDAALFIDRFGVTDRGNFEGQTVLTVSTSVEALAETHDLAATAVQERLERALEDVAAARADRPRPARDEKVLAAWNGLAISAFARGARTLGDDVLGPARESLSFVRTHCWNVDERRLDRRFKDGDVAGPGFLDDYAFLARGALDVYQATGDVEPLAFALDLARAIDARFWDEDAGTLYFTPSDGESLVVRPQERIDQSTPSSLGVALDVFVSLDHLAPTEGFGDRVETALATHASQIRSSPMEHTTLAMVAGRYRNGALEVTLVPEHPPVGWREAVDRAYLPGGIVAPRPASEDDLEDWLDVLGLEEVPPIWAGRDAPEGEATAYVCRSFTCSPPLSDPREVAEWVDRLAPAVDGE